MSAKPIAQAKFSLGQIVATPNALSQLTHEDIFVAIQRHQAGDWGDLDAEDRAANEAAVLQGSRILSAYHAAKGTKFWIITDAGHQTTTVLLPEDY